MKAYSKRTTRTPLVRLRRASPRLVFTTALMLALAVGLVLSLAQWVTVTRGAGTTTLTPLAVSQETGEKPQSKVWLYNNTWWAVMPNSSGTYLWRLEPDYSWTSVLKLSTSDNARADVKAIGGVTHILLHDSTPELVSVEHVSAGNTYQLWSTRPTATSISHSGSEIATIDIDSTGRMWLATEKDSPGNVQVYYSDSPYSSFTGPITLATNINDDDITDVIAMPGNKVGVLWSNQNTQRFGFKTHVDGADPSTWSADEVPASQSALNVGAGMADDHLNMKVAADGTLYAAVKTSYDTSGYPKIALLVRRPTGTWDNLYEVDQSGTRGIVALNEAAGTLRVIYTTSEGGGDIVYKESPVSSISFGSRQTLMAGPLNNATSTKQNWTDSLVVLAANGDAHGVLITNDATPTPTVPTTNTPSTTATPTPTVPPTNTPSTTATPDPCGADGLVGYWAMDEGSGTTLLDSSSPANNGTLPVAGTWVSPGKVGSYALSLNGTSQYATVANDSCLNITGPITLAVWLKPGQKATQHVLKKALMGTDDGYELSLGNAGQAFFRLNQNTSRDTYRVNATVNYPTDGNTWVHLAATYDGSTMRLYVDGVLNNSVAGPAAILTNTGQASIGAQRDGTYKFKGQIDEARIYRRALSASEIAALAGLPPTPTPTPTVTPIGADTPTSTPTATPLPPSAPTLNAPPDGAVGVSTSPTLDVTVSDPDGNPLTVTFYGRPVPTPGTSDFTMVVLPDTQSYISNPSYSPTFGAQTLWVANTKNSLNTAFVSHVGDIVEHIDASEQEWTDASGYMATLDSNGVRNNVALGNHDISTTGVAAKFDQYFPVSRYEEFSWYGGYLGKDLLLDPVNRKNKDNYELFSVGSLDFIVIHLEQDVPSYALSWADRILKGNPTRRAIISTHAYLTAAGGRPTSVTYRTDDGTSAEAVWQQLIKPNCNVFLVISGHYLGEARRTDVNDCGKPVYQVVQDYQGRANGGDGWLRYFTFDPEGNKIYAYTYSPTRNGGLGEFETDANSQFTLDYDMQGGGEFQVIATNSGVPSGSNTTTVWQSLSAETQYEWYVTVSDATQTTTGPTWTFTTSAMPPTETATPTPTETPTPTSTPTNTPTATNTPVPPTNTPTPTSTPTSAATSTPTSTPTATPTAAATVCPGDSDCDSVPDSKDNCPFVSNAGQGNSDSGPPPSGTGAIDNGPGIGGDDATIPNGDTTGDACDSDRDNDGLPDSQDTNPLGATGICAAFASASDLHPNPAGGDVTNDDDHDGDPAPPMGTDASDNGPSWDTDNDGFLDGYECAHGSNPRNGLSRPAALPDDLNDSDVDGLLNGWERAHWGTNPAVVDSDGDTLGDCREAADVDGNGVVNFTGDVICYAKASLLDASVFGKDGDFDIDGNNVINFTGDVIQEAKFGLLPGLCK